MFSQDLRADIESRASVYASLLQLNETLFPTASQQCVKTIKEKFEELDERWKALPQTVDKRFVLQNVFYMLNECNQYPDEESRRLRKGQEHCFLF